MLTLEKFKQASAIVKEVTLPTKLVYSEYLSKQTGADVYLKPENMQYTGAYKVRGAYYKISTMSEEDRKKGLVTASAGNHAQGVAYAAKKFGCKATVVMPTVTPLIKVNRTKSYGAEVVLHGDVYDDACAYAMKLAEEEGYTFVKEECDIPLRIAVPGETLKTETLRLMPTANGFHTTKLFIQLISPGGVVSNYDIEAPIMKSGGKYQINLEFEEMKPYMYLTSTKIDDWTEEWIYRGEILNPED